MLYRTYGRTGTNVSVIGFGGMRFADQKDIDSCAGLLKSAYDHGISYFDTAPGYGESEDLFGVAFKEMKQTRATKPFYVATKTMLSEPDEIRRELETSLKRMGLDYVDFYHVWCVMSLESYQQRKARGALKAFERLKAEGLIRHVCVSTHMKGDDIGVMLEDYPFEGILLGYSAMNFSYRQAGLDAAGAKNMGVVVMNPLGGGLIPQNPQRFAFVKTRSEESVTQAALRFLINDPRISVALVGFNSEQQLQEALAAVDGYAPIAAENIAAIRQNIRAAFDQLCTGCRYCDACPEEIPIPQMMDAYNQYMLTGKDSAINDRLKWHWALRIEDDLAGRCTACGQCEELCTQSLPIIQRLEKIHKDAKSASLK